MANLSKPLLLLSLDGLGVRAEDAMTLSEIRKIGWALLAGMAGRSSLVV